MTSEYLELMEDMKKEKMQKKGEGPWKVRGTATFHADHSVEFTPQGTGDPVQKNVRKLGESRYYETEGGRRSPGFHVVHLKAPMTSADPVADMAEQLEQLTAPLRKTKSAPEVVRERCLLDGFDVMVYFAKREKRVRIEMRVPTDCSDMTAYLLDLTSQVSRCFAINETSLRPRRK